MSRRLVPFAVLAALAALPGCGEYTLYDVTIDTLLVDQQGEPVRERRYTLCPEFVYDNGDVEVPGCEEGFTDRAGMGSVGVIFQNLKEVTEARATLQVEGTDADGGVTSMSSAPADPGLDVTVISEFAIDRAILPTQVTRFHLVGSVSGGREEGIPNATGTLDIDVDLPDNLGTFHGSGPITTDGSAVYSVEVDVVSNYAFPLYEDAITATIDIDGFVGEGFLQDMTVESGDPRAVSGFGSF